MSKLDDILNKPLDQISYELAKRQDQQTTDAIGAELKGDIKQLFLELIGNDVDPIGSGGGVYAVRIKGGNNVRADLRQKVKEL